MCSFPRVLSLNGGLYCSSASELLEFSVSASQATVGCTVPLKEGMRPAPVEDVKTAEVGGNEKEAEKSEGTAVAEEAKVSEEQPVVYV